MLRSAIVEGALQTSRSSRLAAHQDAILPGIQVAAQAGTGTLGGEAEFESGALSV